MDTQQIIVWLVVAVAAAYLLRNTMRAWRRFRSPLNGGSGGCASGCGKCGYAADTSSTTNILDDKRAAPNLMPESAVIPTTSIGSPGSRRN